MPTRGLLALLDDITSLLDDVATMTKVATKKTAGVIGDDLALNANQLTGICVSRELPVVVAVAKGSLINKAILIPAALLISAGLPFLIKPLLMVGGAFLCFEGVEKIAHRLFHGTRTESSPNAVSGVDPVQLERERIKGAIVTDFILSAEILVIALGAAEGATLLVRAITLCAIGLGMTILVYGSVALIIKADDFGLMLQSSQGPTVWSRGSRVIGKWVVLGAPKLMKLLSFLGTTAMFLVGGEILIHGVPALERAIAFGGSSLHALIPRGAAAFSGVLTSLAVILFGILVGLMTLAVVSGVREIRRYARGPGQP
jgi:predicted DNA repair protein MutK